MSTSGRDTDGTTRIFYVTSGNSQVEFMRVTPAGEPSILRGGTERLKIDSTGVVVTAPISASSGVTSAGPVTLSGTSALSVGGTSTLTGAVSAPGGVTAGTLSVGGASTLGGAVTLSGTSPLSVGGTSTLTGAVSAPGGVTAGTLSVGGASTLTGAVTASAGVTSAGPVTLSGTSALSVGGTSTLTGAVTAASGIAVSGTNALRLGSGVAGKEANAGSIGYTTVTSDALDVFGAGTTTANRKVKVWAEGGLSATGGVSAQGNLSVTGTSALTGAVTASAGITSGGAVSITGSNALSVGGNATVGGTLSVTGASTLSGNLSVGGTLSAAGTKQFDIPHPLLEGSRLRHAALEAPTADLVYRGCVEVGEDGSARVSIDEVARMERGTFEALTSGSSVPHTVMAGDRDGFVPARARVSGGFVEIEAAEPGVWVSWVVIAERAAVAFDPEY